MKVGHSFECLYVKAKACDIPHATLASQVFWAPKACDIPHATLASQVFWAPNLVV